MNEKRRNLLNKLKKPPVWVLILLYGFTAVSAACAIVLAILQPSNALLRILSFILYGLAAISLSWTVYTLVFILPKCKDGMLRGMRKIGFLERMLDNYGFRTVILSGVSLFLNVLYAAFNAVIGFLEKSVWYGALAGYYILLTLLRSGIVLYHRKKAKNGTAFESEREEKLAEIKKCAVCGYLLIALPLFLSAAILETVVSEQGYQYMGLTIYVVAAWTFLKISLAIYNAIKARKKSDDLTVQALRSVRLADALVSVLALQTAMFHSFGTEFTQKGLFNALTGGVVCALTVLIGSYTVYTANRKKKILQKEFDHATQRTK